MLLEKVPKSFQLSLLFQKSMNVSQEHFVFFFLPLRNKELHFTVDGFQCRLWDFLILSQTVSGDKEISLYCIENSFLNNRGVSDKFLKLFISSFSIILQISFLLMRGWIIFVELKVLKFFHGLLYFTFGLSNFFVVLFFSLLFGLEVCFVVNNALVQSWDAETALDFYRVADIRTELRIFKVMKPGLFHDIIGIKICLFLGSIGCLLVALFVRLFRFLFKGVVWDAFSVWQKGTND